jgi:hypothetical protein
MAVKHRKKSVEILQAVTDGRLCEQILATDGTVTYHDIFHALTTAPTSFWKRNENGFPRLKHRRD